MVEQEESKYSISQVSEKIGFKPHVIRFYEKEFNLNIPRSENSRRYFSHKEIHQLLKIKSLQENGYSNKEIKNILNLENSDACATDSYEVIDLVTVALDNQIIDQEEISYNKNETYTSDIYDYKGEIEELKNKIDELIHKVHALDPNKEDDILLCENARLKMKLKEKSYEVSELKDRLKRIDSKKPSIFQKIFRRGIQI